MMWGTGLTAQPISVPAIQRWIQHLSVGYAAIDDTNRRIILSQPLQS
jgi:hypothetical protein